MFRPTRLFRSHDLSESPGNPILDMKIIQSTDFDPFASKHAGAPLPASPQPQRQQEQQQQQTTQQGQQGQQRALGAQDILRGNMYSNQPTNNETNLQTEQSRPRNVELDDDMIINGLKSAKTGQTPGQNSTQNPGQNQNQQGGQQEQNEEQPANQGAYYAHYKSMVDAGEWEAEDDFDGSREKYLQIRQKNAVRHAEQIHEEWMQEAFRNNPDGMATGMRLFKHLMNGGKAADFVQLAAPQEFDMASLDSDDTAVAEESARRLANEYYTMIGWTPQQIQNRMAHLAKTGMLIDDAKQIREPYLSLVKQKEANITKTLSEQKEKQRRDTRQLNEGLLNIIEKNHTFGDLKVFDGKQEQQEVKSYYFMQKDELNGNTQFNVDLAAHMSDPVFIAYIGTAMRKGLHKNAQPAGAGNNAGVDQLEETLSKALLNKNINSKDSRTSIQTAQDSSNKQSKYQFDLENAVPLS